jgi:chromosome segregation ATPase
VSSPSYSFAVDDLVAEKGDEASSSQALSEENQAKLKEILSLLQRDVQDQVKDADLLREALEFIDQDLPADIKTSLEPVSQLDNHFAAVKHALKNLSSQPALEQRRATTKQFVKDLHAQIQNNKELLANLQPALELKKTRKAALEAELRNLTAEIEADERKMAKLPESTEKIRKEASAALNAERQLKTKLSALSKTQEADQKLLETSTRSYQMPPM